MGVNEIKSSQTIEFHEQIQQDNAQAGTTTAVNHPITAEGAAYNLAALLNYGSHIQQNIGLFAPAQTGQTGLTPLPNAAAFEGLSHGSSSANVEPLQKFLVGAGYQDTPQRYGYFGDATQAALIEFQTENGIPATGVVDEATIRALENPRPRAGYGMNNLDGTLPQSNAVITHLSSSFNQQLGAPTSPVTEANGSTTQTFENGVVTQAADGTITINDHSGNPLLSPPSYPSVQAAERHLISQLDGDAAGANNNCGYTSLLMGLNFLGVPNSAIPNSDGSTNNYDLTMDLKANGQPNASSQASDSLAAGIYRAADGVPGVTATAFGPPDLTLAETVEAMKAGFLSSEPPTAFVVGGNPATGWGGEGSEFNGAYDTSNNNPYNGGHFVTVIGYNPETDKFMVLDPIAGRPIEVSSQQMQQYMSDGNVSSNDVTQLTYTQP